MRHLVETSTHQRKPCISKVLTAHVCTYWWSHQVIADVSTQDITLIITLGPKVFISHSQFHCIHNYIVWTIFVDEICQFTLLYKLVPPILFISYQQQIVVLTTLTLVDEKQIITHIMTCSCYWIRNLYSHCSNPLHKSLQEAFPDHVNVAFCHCEWKWASFFSEIKDKDII